MAEVCGIAVFEVQIELVRSGSLDAVWWREHVALWWQFHLSWLLSYQETFYIDVDALQDQGIS